MLPRNDLDRIQIAFDDHLLVANAGCSFRSPWPSAWVCVNSSTSTLTWEMRSVGQTREIIC